MQPTVDREAKRSRSDGLSCSMTKCFALVRPARRATGHFQSIDAVPDIGPAVFIGGFAFGGDVLDVHRRDAMAVIFRSRCVDLLAALRPRQRLSPNRCRARLQG